MGKLRNILSSLIKYNPDKKLTSEICTHPNLPQKQHFTKLIVNAIVIIVGLVQRKFHIQQHCSLTLKVNKEFGQGLLRDFNYGYLMELPLSGLKCTCGKPLGHQPDHAICAACGMASCSAECHLRKYPICKDKLMEHSQQIIIKLYCMLCQGLFKSCLFAEVFETMAILNHNLCK